MYRIKPLIKYLHILCNHDISLSLERGIYVRYVPMYSYPYLALKVKRMRRERYPLASTCNLEEGVLPRVSKLEPGMIPAGIETRSDTIVNNNCVEDDSKIRYTIMCSKNIIIVGLSNYSTQKRTHP